MSAMADGLFATKTRLALVRAVDAGHVWLDYDSGEAILEAPRQQPPQRKVTARVGELESAGWVTREASSRYRLTDAGRAVLADA